MGRTSKKMTPAEKQRRYRERRRLNQEREELNKAKDRARYVFCVFKILRRQTSTVSTVTLSYV